MVRNETQSNLVADTDVQSQSLHWKPTLRRIQKGLFSTKKGPLPPREFTSIDPVSIDPLSAVLREGEAYTPITTIVTTRYVPRRAATLSKTRPSESREGKVFPFRRPSIPASKSRTNKHRPTGSQGGLLAGSIDTQYFGTTPYIPKHAAADFSKSTQPKRTSLPSRPTVQKSPRAPASPPSKLPYTPTHAASDFCKIKLATKPSDTETKRPSLTRFDDVNNDYQLFLAAARAAAAQNYNVTGVISPNRPRPCPQVAKNQEIVRQGAISISRHSIQDSMISSRPASIVEEKAREEFKTGRAESTYSQAAKLSDEKGSVKGIVDGRSEKRSVNTGRELRRSPRTSISTPLSSEDFDFEDEVIITPRAPGRRKALKLLGLTEKEVEALPKNYAHHVIS